MYRLLGLLLACCGLVWTAEGDAYRAVAQAMQAQANRQPGSPGYTAGIEAVARTLDEAGLNVHRLTYPTLGLATTACSFIVDGVSIDGVQPMAPNGVVPSTSWGGDITGPVLWLGDGTLAEMQAKPITGSIALLRMGSPNVAQVFSQGARAVIAIDDGSADQWQTARMFTEAPIASPRAWLQHSTAEAAGLLADGRRQGVLRIGSTWRDAAATSLWTLIPARDGTPASEANQVVVLAAELATSGAVPERVPGGRQAANCALLAELAVRLHARPAGRPVLVVFLGSHYAGQDGARLLYWIVDQVHRAGKVADPLAKRAVWADEQRQVCERRLAMLDQADLLTRGGDDAFYLRTQLRRVLTAQMNTTNYAFRQVNLELAAAAKDGDEGKAPLLKQRQQDLRARLDGINTDRKQLFERVIEDAASFKRLCQALGMELTALRDHLASLAADNRSWMELEQALAGHTVITHLGIDLADATSPWMANPFGLSAKATWSTDWGKRSRPGHFTKHITAYQQAWNRIATANPTAPAMRCPDQTAAWSYDALNVPHRRLVACVAAQGLGIMGSQLETIGDPLPRDELPVDPAPDLLPMAAPLANWIDALLGSDMPMRTGLVACQSANERLVWKWGGSRWEGLRIDRLAPGSEEVAGPAAGSLVFASIGRQGPELGDEDIVCGRLNGAIGRVNPAGYLFMPNVTQENLDSQLSAIDLDDQGSPLRFYQPKSGGTPFNLRMFTGWGNGVYVPLMPADYGMVSNWKRLMATTDSAVKRSFGGVGGGGLMVVTDERRPLKLVGNGLFLLGSDGTHAQGSGLPTDAASLLSLDVLRRSAEDTSLLNHQRLDILRSKNLINRPVERINAAANTHLAKAKAARAAGDVRLAAGHETIASILGWRAQGPLRDNANDLLKAVVFLLLLAIPFAFVLERLIIGAVSIYRQIGGFLAIFVGTFGFLYVTHPAFALADAPLIIFLAFIIILLSAFVIGVVMGKFKREISAMQGLATQAHSTGTGNSTTMAAVVIGIAGMRNRPLKTFLTATTVTLLTFTILVFASFESSQGVVETWLGKSRGADRIEVHQKSFLAMPERLIESIEAVHGQRFEVLRRSAHFRNPLTSGRESPQLDLILQPTTGRTFQLDAMLGLDPRETARLGLCEGLSDTDNRPGLWLSNLVATQLQITPGTEVRIRGTAFTFAGTFDEAKLKAMENIDGSRLTPPDFTATFANAPPKDGGFNEAIDNLDITSFVFSSPALTGITTDRAVRGLGGSVNHLSLYPKDGQVDLARHAGDIAAAFNAPVHGTDGNGARSWFFTSELSGSGLSDLLVPLLLGGLIIFSSLLGSIVDRQKEIFTYSALGLSPRDVGMLFFAESSVIAVVGGMGGYLVGQLVSKALNLMAERGLVEIPPLNFSSTSSLITIGIVMAMVLLSTIYPALMASRSANPGINRSWKMPKPDGDKLVFTFPFTVPEQSFGGIVGFIREHFRNHGDAALDVFAAQQVRLFKVDAQRIGIAADISLAPFDLGVFQRFRMSTKPSDVPGIDEVVVEIERTNGAPGSWLRGNAAFIKDLRQQFLIWRSLPAETVAHYQAEAGRFADGADGGVDGTR